MTIVIIILLALIYWRLHDIVTAIHFQGTIFDHEDYFNKQWMNDVNLKNFGPTVDGNYSMTPLKKESKTKKYTVKVSNAKPKPKVRKKK